MRSYLLFLLFLAFLVASCVTDPMAEKHSSYVKELKDSDARCRKLVAARLTDGGKNAVYYYGQLPREAAKTYAVVYLKAGGAASILCDDDAGKVLDTKKLSAAEAKVFAAAYAKRRKDSLAGHKSELKMSETASGAVVELDRAGKATEFWLPRHVEKELSDLFYDLWK